MRSNRTRETACHNYSSSTGKANPQGRMKTTWWFESRAIFGGLWLLGTLLYPNGLTGQATNNAQPAKTQASATPQTQTTPAAATTTVTVTAYRTPLSDLESPATTRLMTARTLSTAA